MRYIRVVRNSVVRSPGAERVSDMTEVSTARRSRITPEREAELYEAVLELLREVATPPSPWTPAPHAPVPARPRSTASGAARPSWWRRRYGTASLAVGV